MVHSIPSTPTTVRPALHPGLTGPIQSIEQIGGTEALEMLKTNHRNRPVNASQVELLAGQIKAGLWKLNGESIKFSIENRLLDGQHRLRAVVLAGRPITTTVVRGLDPDVFDTIDVGLKRSLGTILGMRGEKNYNHLARALNMLNSYINGELPHISSIPAVTAEALLQSNPGIRESLALSHGIRGFASCGMAAAFHYIFASKEPTLALAFITGMAKGFDPARYPTFHAMRERLMFNSVSRAKLNYRDVILLIAKAWNKTRLGLSTTRIVLTDNEAFPAIQ